MLFLVGLARKELITKCVLSLMGVIDLSIVTCKLEKIKFVVTMNVCCCDADA